VTGARAAAAAAAAGAASVAGFGDPVLFPLPIAALAVLGWLWVRATSWRRAALLGFAFGAGLFMAGVSWVYVSLHEFGMMPAPLAGIATLLFCLYLALFPAAVGALQARFPAAPRTRLLLVIPALWMLAEWLRGWLLTGFPWLAIGYSQLDGPLQGLFPVVGVYGVGFAAAAAAGGLVIGRFGRLPKRGEAVEIDGLRFAVLRADSRRLHLLQVERVPEVPV
jgi:apolipoprotein N-acyltransferase